MKESKLVEVFVQAPDETYFKYLLLAMGKPFIEVLQMGEIIEDGIKTGRIVSFSTLKATTQAIQSGLRAFGGKKKKEEVATVVAGLHDYTKRPPHPYFQSQAQVYAQPPYILPTITTLCKTHYIHFHHLNTQYIVHNHTPKPLLTHNGMRQPLKIIPQLQKITKILPNLVFNLGPSLRKGS